MAEPSTSSQAEPEGRETRVVSLLDRLKAPDSSDLSRKRKVATNKGGNRRNAKKKSEKDYEPQVSATTRLEEFKDESLKAMSNTVLFCNACKEEISVKKSVIKGHVQSKKHIAYKEKLKTTKKKELDIAEAFAKFDKQHHPKGETLPTATRVFRIKVVQAFLKSGTPLNRLEYFRDIFQEAGMPLTSHTHMRELVPFILEEEYKSIAKELLGKDVSIIFDGTTRDGEALAILVRYVQDWDVKIRLVRFRLVKSSVNGDELARVIIEVLHRKLDLMQGNLIAAMRDRAPVNTKALRTVSIIYPDMMDIGCISHFLDRVGTKCLTPVLSPFMTSWNYIFTTSMKARRIFKELTGRGMPRYNSTRWWSLWECVKVIFEELEHVPTFLQSDEAFAEASRRKLADVLLQSPVQLKVEMAAVMELENFVKATYTLEGDGSLVFIAYEKLQQLKAFIEVGNFPTLTTKVQELFPLDPVQQQQWYGHGLRQCLLPAFEYFLGTMANDVTVSRSVALFKAAQLFSPKYVKLSRPTANDVDDCIRAVPFLRANNVVMSLKDELPQFIAKAISSPDDFDDQTDILPWWKATAIDLPCWATAAQKMVLVQPSSAAAERVFSLLVTMFGDQQHETLEDYIEAALMLRVNNR